jgi:hypothetical protein
MADPMPSDPRLRASDADRDRTASLLREHHAVGRLTAEEFNDRVEKTFAARTLVELDELLADLPAIDLYQLPSAGIRPAAPGAVRRRGGPGRGRRGDGALASQPVPDWVTWTVSSALLVAVWLGVAAAAGGLAWLPWVLLIIIPWAFLIGRRPQD